MKHNYCLFSVLSCAGKAAEVQSIISMDGSTAAYLFHQPCPPSCRAGHGQKHGHNSQNHPANALGIFKQRVCSCWGIQEGKDAFVTPLCSTAPSSLPTKKELGTKKDLAHTAKITPCSYNPFFLLQEGWWWWWTRITN